MVHAAAIAATSKCFDALINGGLEKSNSRCARFEDVRVDDLIQFCEYACVVCEIDTIGKCDEFSKYIEEGGEFVGDFWKLVRSYTV